MHFFPVQLSHLFSMLGGFGGHLKPLAAAKLTYVGKSVSPWRPSRKTGRLWKPASCSPEEAYSNILCESCNGKGWLVCDFCKGQKTNVRSRSSRIYRRCPTCRAIGYVLCSKCKVFKCVTYPDFVDGDGTCN